MNAPRPRIRNLLLLGVVLVGLHEFTANALPPQFLTIRPGQVSQLPDGSLQGEFRLAKGFWRPKGKGPFSRLEPVGIRSMGHGGACLVTDLGVHIACLTAGMCQPPPMPNGGPLDTVAGGYGYCLTEGDQDRLDRVPGGRCWWKGRGPEWCIQQPPPGTPLQLNEPRYLPQKSTVEVRFDPVEPWKLHPGRSASYRIATCLNPTTRRAVDEEEVSLPACKAAEDQGQELLKGKPTSIPGTRPPPAPPRGPLRPPCGSPPGPPCGAKGS